MATQIDLGKFRDVPPIALDPDIVAQLPDLADALVGEPLMLQSDARNVAALTARNSTDPAVLGIAIRTRGSVVVDGAVIVDGSVSAVSITGEAGAEISGLHSDIAALRDELTALRTELEGVKTVLRETAGRVGVSTSAFF